MKKLLLINPVSQKSGYLLSKFSRMPPLSLAYVASVTPPTWEVKIIDENIKPFEYEPADLVGITAFTSSINRAYEIAQLYRRDKIKVVIGGIHPSVLPDEALRYVDAVVVGEVEGVWDTIINDFEKNCLSGKYFGPRIDFNQISIKPRRDVLHPGYTFQTLQTSRGCPFRCNFCSVSRYLGKEYRQRPVKDVLDELQEIRGKHIFFLDDNLIGYSPESKRRAIGIFEGMLERGMDKMWWMQTSVNSAEDEHVLRLAGQSGCMLALIGFETTNERRLKDMNKGVNLQTGVKNYRKVVDTFHRHGIGVFGTFIIGNDNESPDYYKELAKFIVYSGIDVVQITILTPLPGTKLMEEMERSGSLVYNNFPEDWNKYRLSHVVRKLQGVDAETVYIGDNYIKNYIYSSPIGQLRILKSLISIKNLRSFQATYKFNNALKRNWEGSHYYKKYPKKFGSN